VLHGFFAFSSKADKWHACDCQLKLLAHMATASLVCSFCLDLGYFQARHEKLDLDKARWSSQPSSGQPTWRPAPNRARHHKVAGVHAVAPVSR
jgi:hypothetical protein